MKKYEQSILFTQLNSTQILESELGISSRTVGLGERSWQGNSGLGLGHPPLRSRSYFTARKGVILLPRRSDLSDLGNGDQLYAMHVRMLCISVWYGLDDRLRWLRKKLILISLFCKIGTDIDTNTRLRSQEQGIGEEKHMFCLFVSEKKTQTGTQLTILDF